MISPLGAPGAGSAPRQLTALGERVLFSAADGVERRLFASDGTAGATIPLTGGPDPEQLTVAGGIGFFSVNLPNDAGSELWTTDGTPDGTRVLATFADRAVSHLLELAGRLVFLVSSTLGERPLHAFFASDGTAAGTAKLFDLPDDTVSVADVAGLGGEIYFVARGESGIRLLRSDGTPAGTRPIYELPCDCTSPGQPLSYARVGQNVFLTALAEGAFGLGTALFRSDGTAAGTVVVIPPFAGPAQRIVEPSALFSFGGDLYYFARSPELAGEARSGLFRGTGLDAVQLSSAGSEPGREALPQYTAAGDTLFFRAWDPEHGFELWKTDGTPAGTQLVEDIAPGPLSSDPRGLLAAAGRLFFAATDELHGRELWTSDGSGTRLVQDLAPGPPSSAPEEMTQLGTQLFFAADDGLVGREPWRLAF
jgi:ELWxxDGT repeat protein